LLNPNLLHAIVIFNKIIKILKSYFLANVVDARKLNTKLWTQTNNKLGLLQTFITNVAEKFVPKLINLELPSHKIAHQNLNSKLLMPPFS